jgi:hypothetical protein
LDTIGSGEGYEIERGIGEFIYEAAGHEIFKSGEAGALEKTVTCFFLLGRVRLVSER